MIKSCDPGGGTTIYAVTRCAIFEVPFSERNLFLGCHFFGKITQHTFWASFWKSTLYSIECDQI